MSVHKFVLFLVGSDFQPCIIIYMYSINNVSDFHN